MYRSVLCLFDCEEATEMLQATFGSTCKVMVVPTIFAALQELKKFTPDMIVVQVGLREESCFDFFKAVRQMVALKQIPMIAVCVSDVFHESIETFIKKSCSFFGCQNYLSHTEFKSQALRFLWAQRVHSASLTKAC